MISRKQSNRKATGGIYRDGRKRRLSEKGGVFVQTLIGALKKKSDRVRGGNNKQRVLRTEKITVHDGKKVSQATIKRVVESEANRNFVRRNIMTKGAIVETDIGKVKITSRPGQSGSLSGILVK